MFHALPQGLNCFFGDIVYGDTHIKHKPTGCSCNSKNTNYKGNHF